MSVTFRQLKQFIVLSEELHFGRAAKRLNITQPPLSTGLKQLETSLGFRLMDRSKKSVRLTPAGAAFAGQAIKILDQLSSAQAHGLQIAHGSRGKISVGFVPSMLLRNLPNLLRSFELSYPGTELELHETNTNRQLNEILGHKIDVGFLHAAPVPEGVECKPVLKERLVCCVNRNHRLSGRGRIEIRDLTGERVLLFHRDYAEHYYDRIEGLLRGYGVQVHTGYALRNWAGIIALIAQELGVALVPHSLGSSVFSGVTFLELEERTAEHTLYLAWSKNSQNPVTKSFLSFVESKSSELASSNPP